MKSARSNWRGAALVCGKCSKKIRGGFGDDGRTPLAKALRKQSVFGKGRKAGFGVVEVKCLGLCPKHAVTVVDSRRPDRWLVVPAGANIAALATMIADAAETHTDDTAADPCSAALSAKA